MRSPAVLRHRARYFWPTAWVSSAYVKPYVKRNKNDAADAEAVSRPCAAPYERPWGLAMPPPPQHSET